MSRISRREALIGSAGPLLLKPQTAFGSQANSAVAFGVIGAGGQIKLRFEAGLEQRTRLEMEGVRFIGKRVDLAAHQHRFRPWEFEVE